MSDIKKNFLDEVGGRNLVLNSNWNLTSSYYMIKEFNTSEELTEGEVYTLTIRGQLGEDRSYFRLYTNNGYSHFFKPDGTIGGGILEKVSEGVYRATFRYSKHPSSTHSNNTFRIYQQTSDVTSESYINTIKLEKGNKATEWTPAPEDINNKKYVKNTRYGINKILAYYYPSVKGSEKDTYLFLNHLNNSIYTTNYKIALCLTLIENEKFNMTRFQELKSKINHLSKYIYSLETLIRYTLENKIYIKD